MIKDIIIEICDERTSAFCTKIAFMIETRTLMLREFRVVRLQIVMGVRDPIVSSRWLADVTNALRTRHCLGRRQDLTYFLFLEG